MSHSDTESLIDNDPLDSGTHSNDSLLHGRNEQEICEKEGDISISLQKLEELKDIIKNRFYFHEN